MFEGIVTAFGTLFVVVIILVLTYVCTKWIGKSFRYQGAPGNSRYIKVLDRIALGQDTSVAMVKASGKVLLLGITSGQISVLSEYKEDEIVPEPEMTQTGQNVLFKDVIQRLKDGKKL